MSDTYDGCEDNDGQRPVDASELPSLEAEAHDGPEDMLMPLGHCTILRGLDRDGEPALWFDVTNGLDQVTALGMVEMLRQHVLDSSRPRDEDD